MAKIVPLDQQDLETWKQLNAEALEEILVNLNKENLYQMGSNAQEYIFSWSFKAITEAIEKTILSN